MRELSAGEIRAAMLEVLRSAKNKRLDAQAVQARIIRQIGGYIDPLVWQHTREDAIADGDVAWFDPGTNTVLCLPHHQDAEWRKQNM